MQSVCWRAGFVVRFFLTHTQTAQLQYCVRTLSFLTHTLQQRTVLFPTLRFVTGVFRHANDGRFPRLRFVTGVFRHANVGYLPKLRFVTGVFRHANVGSRDWINCSETPTTVFGIWKVRLDLSVYTYSNLNQFQRKKQQILNYFVLEVPLNVEMELNPEEKFCAIVLGWNCTLYYDSLQPATGFHCWGFSQSCSMV